MNTTTRNQMITDNQKELIYVIKWLWTKTYEKPMIYLNIDYAEYEMICLEIIVGAMDKFDETKSKVATFVINVLNNRLKTYIRNINSCIRKANIDVLSIATPIVEEDGKTIEDTIEDNMDIDTDVVQSDIVMMIKNACRNKREQDMVQMLADGMCADDICEVLHITKNMFTEIKNSFCQRSEILRIASIIGIN